MTDGELVRLRLTLSPNSAQQWQNRANNPKWFADSSINTLPLHCLSFGYNSETTQLSGNDAALPPVPMQQETCWLPASTHVYATTGDCKLITRVTFLGHGWNITSLLRATGSKVRIPRVPPSTALGILTTPSMTTLTLSKLLMLPMLPKRPRIRLAPWWQRWLHNMRNVSKIQMG